LNFKKWITIVLIILFFFFIFNLDNITSIKKIKISKVFAPKIIIPEDIHSYNLSFDNLTYYSGISNSTEKDILLAMENDNLNIAMITDCTKYSSRFENVYGDRIILSDCSIQNKIIQFDGLEILPYKTSGEQRADCEEIMNLGKSIELSFSNILKAIKFSLWYPFSKEKAYYNLYKMMDIEEQAEKLDPQLTTCIIGGVGSYSKIKYNNTSLPDLTYMLKLVKNKIYTTEILTTDLKKDRDQIIKALKNGNNIIIFGNEDIDFDVYVETPERKYYVGDLIEMSSNPVIKGKIKGTKVLTAVYKNGKLIKYLDQISFEIKPKTTGYYTFVLYKYSVKLPFGIYLGVKPVSVTNSIYLQ